jgi:hypothetical protein
LEKEAASGKSSNTLLWQTKSLSQAVGEVAPIDRIMRDTKKDPNLVSWLKDSSMESEADYLPYVNKVLL